MFFTPSLARQRGPNTPLASARSADRSSPHRASTPSPVSGLQGSLDVAAAAAVAVVVIVVVVFDGRIVVVVVAVGLS